MRTLAADARDTTTDALEVGGARECGWALGAAAVAGALLVPAVLHPSDRLAAPWFVPVMATVVLGGCVMVVAIGAVDAVTHRRTLSLPLTAVAAMLFVLTLTRTVTFPGTIAPPFPQTGQQSAWMFDAIHLGLPLLFLWALFQRPGGDVHGLREAVRWIGGGATAGVAVSGVVVLLAPMLPPLVGANETITHLHQAILFGGLLPVAGVAIPFLRGVRGDHRLAPALAAAIVCLLASQVAYALPGGRLSVSWYVGEILFALAVLTLVAGQLTLFRQAMEREREAVATERRRGRELELLYRGASTLSATLDLDDIRATVTGLAVDVLNDGVQCPPAVLLLHAGASTVTVTGQWCDAVSSLVGRSLPATEFPLMRSVLAGEDAVSTGVTGYGAGFTAFLREAGATGVVWVRVVVDDVPVGAVAVVVRGGRVLTAHETSLVHGVANLAQLALSRGWRYREQQATVDRLDGLVTANVMLSREIDLETVLRTVADTAARLVGARSTAVAVLSADGRSVEAHALGGVVTPAVLPAGPEAARLAVPLPRRRRPYDQSAAREQPGPVGAIARALAGRPALAVPLVDRTAVMGTLFVLDRVSGVSEPFDSREQAVLEGIAAQAVVAINNARLVRRLEENALLDPLTGLHNRRDFERAQALRPRRGYAVLAMDVDNLKVINDEAGHEAGDAALRAVAQVLTAILRDEDRVARIGGDEFWALLEGVERDQALMVADRVRAALEAAPVPHGNARLSVGVALGAPGESVRHVWVRADQALYRAKRSGRDRVVLANGEESQLRGVRWEAILTRVVERRALGSAFQPIVNLRTGAIVGLEALARPRGLPEGATVDGVFAAAQRLGVMRDLDWICRRKALEAARVIPAGIPVFVNVSAGALLDPVHDVDQLELLLRWTGRVAADVVLEITERELVADVQRLVRVLDRYRRAGFRFALDDVGEGRSTIEALVAARPEFVKLAQSLVAPAVPTSASDGVIDAMVAFARRTGAAVIGEGVETAAARMRLERLGVGMAQGFALFRPMPAAAAARLVPSSSLRGTLV